MCEFKVYLNEDDQKDRQMLTKGIVIAIQKDLNVILRDVIGNSEVVENVTIEEVSTMKQELILKRI